MKKPLLVTLFLCLSFGLRAQTKPVAAPDLDKVSLKELDVKTEDLTFDAKNTSNNEPIFLSVEVEPRFQGGIAEFYAYIQQNIIYPINAIKQRKEGKVFAGFVVEKDGSLTNIKILRGVSPEIDAESGRVISNSPKWFPGLQNGLAARVQYVIPITFKLPPPEVLRQQLLLDSLQNLPEKKVFSGVELEPSFPGGLDRFYMFLQHNIRYPAEAVKNKTQGKVFVSFVVERDGSLTDIRILRGIGSGCDEEAARVISISPKWLPGMQNGRHVRVQYTMPISFSLNKI